MCAGLAFFGISTHMAGHHNRAFERHFQELAKVRADRRKLKEENEELRREIDRLKGRVSYSPPPPPPAEKKEADGASGDKKSTEKTYTFQG